MLDATTLPTTLENTRLRPLYELDADAYVAGTRDEAVRRFGHLPESDYTPESVRRMIRDEVAEGLSSGTLAVLALADAKTDRFVGSLVLFDVSSEAAEVGFWIHPDARGAGHARRGLELASRFARNSGLRTLTARTLLENKASQRCLTNAGFREVERAVGTTPAGQREELFHYRRDLKPTAQWPLATERLRLRPHNADDAEWLHELYSRPDVARYLLDEPWTAEVTHDKLTERLAKTDIDGETGALALVIEHDGVPIGDVTFGSPITSTVKARSGGFSTRRTVGKVSPAKPSEQYSPSGLTTTGSTASPRRWMPATAPRQHWLVVSGSGSKHITSRTGSARANGPTHSSSRDLPPSTCANDRESDFHPPCTRLRNLPRSDDVSAY